jgi:ATP-binding cassette subfamily F protein 3
VLQQALADYTGTYLIVSHNRAFLDPIVNKTLEFRVGEPPRLYLGNLSYYLEKKAEEKARMNQPAPVSTSAASAQRGGTEIDVVNAKERRRLEAQRRQEKTRTLKPLQEQLEKVETTISDLETEKAALTKMMSSEGFGDNAGAVVETTSRFAAVEHALERAFSQCSTVSEEIERAERKFGDDV